jgi:hypothetical protein
MNTSTGPPPPVWCGRSERSAKLVRGSFYPLPLSEQVLLDTLLVLPDFPVLDSQLQQHRHLTLQLAWEEYRQIHPEGYGYSRFCELYQRWRRKQDVVLRQVHQPGEKGFMDWAGATIPVHDPITGEVWPTSLFVMVSARVPTLMPKPPGTNS